MKVITFEIPALDEDTGTITATPIIKSITTVGLQGPPGPGISSNISKITASVDPPSNPQENDLWIDLS